MLPSSTPGASLDYGLRARRINVAEMSDWKRIPCDSLVSASAELLAAKRSFIAHGLVKLANMLELTSRRLSGQDSGSNAIA